MHLITRCLRNELVLGQHLILDLALLLEKVRGLVDVDYLCHFELALANDE